MEGSVSEKRALEANLHRELITSCRKYVRHLGIVNVLGMLEMVKQETIELERATKNELKSETNENQY